MDEKTKSTNSSKSDSINKKDRVIGEGMTSLDSTQAPLKAETGLPDREAMTGGKEPSARKDDKTSK